MKNVLSLRNEKLKLFHTKFFKATEVVIDSGELARAGGAQDNILRLFCLRKYSLEWSKNFPVCP